MKKAVVYARYSSGSQTEQSIEGQLRVCHDFAKQNGLTILNEYIDRAKTAQNDNRPNFQKMLSDSAKKGFEYVIVYAVDRFARDDGDYGYDKKLLRQNNVTILSATEQLGINADGTENLGGILTEGLLVALAKYYSRELSKKVKRGQLESLEKKNFLGSSVLFGYSIKDKKPVINESEADVVRMMFELYSKGVTSREIASRLTEKGYLNSHGRPFAPNTIRNMLKNSKYIGIFKYGERVIECYYPPIVSKDIFEAVQYKIEQNKRNPARLKAHVSYLLSGKLHCGHCKSLMTGESGTGRNGTIYHYYKCFGKKKGSDCEKTNIKKTELEDIIISVTLNHILQPKVFEEITNEILSFQQETRQNSELEVLKGQLSQVKSSLNNMMKAIKEGLFSSTMKTELTSLEKQRETLEEQIVKQELLEREPLTKEHIVFWFKQFDSIDYNEEAARQYLVTYFINKIILYDDKLIIIYNHHGDNRTELSIEEIEEAFGSNLAQLSPPKQRQPLWLLLF